LLRSPERCWAALRCVATRWVVAVGRAPPSGATHAAAAPARRAAPARFARVPCSPREGRGGGGGWRLSVSLSPTVLPPSDRAIAPTPPHDPTQPRHCACACLSSTFAQSCAIFSWLVSSTSPTCAFPSHLPRDATLRRTGTCQRSLPNDTHLQQANDHARVRRSGRPHRCRLTAPAVADAVALHDCCERGPAKQSLLQRSRRGRRQIIFGTPEGHAGLGPCRA
jgi:hypothetical protein